MGADGTAFPAFTDPAVTWCPRKPVRCAWRPSTATPAYSASPQSAPLSREFGNAWILENAAAFYVALPDLATGTCPANSGAVYRFANTAHPTQRRYTAEVDVRDSIIRRGGWTQEGFGPAPDQVAMCAPTAGPSSIGPPQTQTTSNHEGLWWAARNRAGGYRWRNRGCAVPRLVRMTPAASVVAVDAGTDRARQLFGDVHRKSSGPDFCPPIRTNEALLF
jgi:hypothetical protein